MAAGRAVHGVAPRWRPGRHARDQTRRPACIRRGGDACRASRSSSRAISSPSTGRSARDPNSPFGEYLSRTGAVGTLTSRTLRIEPAPDDLARRLETLRRGAAESLARVLPEPEAGLAAGILIGLRDRVDRDLAAAFTTAGVSHVVAISGWNIAIVAAAVAAATGRLGRRRRSVVTVVAIVTYVAFAGASPSVVRAAMMAGVVLLARESGRAGRATAALGWAATLLLLADPGLIHDAGFQLSSLATAGLIAWGTPLTERIDSISRGRMPRAVSREPRRVAGSPGRDPADHPGLLRPAGDPLATGEPRRRAARRTGDGRRGRRPRWRRRGGGGCSGDRRGRRRGARLGDPAVARDDRRGQRPRSRSRASPSKPRSTSWRLASPRPGWPVRSGGVARTEGRATIPRRLRPLRRHRPARRPPRSARAS